jgi:hypothetical protein
MSRYLPIIVILLAATAQSATAAVVYLQDVGGNPGFTFTSTPVTQATFDDTYIQTGGSASTLGQNFGVASSMQIRTTSSGLVNFALLAVKDLFSHVPASSGGNPIQINSATIYLATNGINQPVGYTINIRRVTTDWLANASGDNENRVSAAQRNGDAVLSSGAAIVNGQPWSGGGNFSAANDLASTNAVLNAPFVNTVYGNYVGIEITGIVMDMYELGVNYGVAISTSFVQNDFVIIRASEDTLLPATFETFRPVLAIDYTYVPEPGSALAAGGGLGLLLMRRRKQA